MVGVLFFVNGTSPGTNFLMNNMMGSLMHHQVSLSLSCLVQRRIPFIMLWLVFVRMDGGFSLVYHDRGSNANVDLPKVT
jgi:hypothetical protein